jgi:hypothetical protein
MGAFARQGDHALTNFLAESMGKSPWTTSVIGISLLPLALQGCALGLTEQVVRSSGKSRPSVASPLGDSRTPRAAGSFGSGKPVTALPNPIPIKQASPAVVASSQRPVPSWAKPVYLITDGFVFLVCEVGASGFSSRPQCFKNRLDAPTGVLPKGPTTNSGAN